MITNRYCENEELLSLNTDIKYDHVPIAIKLDHVRAEKFISLCLQNDTMSTDSNTIKGFTISKINEDFSIISGSMKSFMKLIDIDFYNNTKIKEIKKTLHKQYPEVFPDIPDIEYVSDEYISVLNNKNLIIAFYSSKDNYKEFIQKHITHTVMSQCNIELLQDLLNNNFDVTLNLYDTLLLITASEMTWCKIISYSEQDNASNQLKELISDVIPKLYEESDGRVKQH